MSFLAMIAILSFTIYTYFRVTFNRAEARRAEVLHTRKKVSLKERLDTLGRTIIGEQQLERLITIEVPVNRYLRDMGASVIAAPILGYLAFHSLVTAFIFALLGYGMNYVRYAGTYVKWHKEVVAYLPDLVTYLKIRLKTGDIVSKAIVSILPMLKGAIAGEWTKVVVMIQAGVPIEAALNSFTERIKDRDITAVMLRLISYSKEGVVDEPFGDLTEHMNHLAAIQKKYELKKMTTPMTIYAGLAMFTALIVGVVPYFYRIIMDLVGQLPPGF